ncbi:MAG TPA: hypothetical protein VMV18_03285 [bacterium]|nr:hypothetical protein [bacterium]
MRARAAAGVRVGVPLLTVVAIGCSLPERNNPNDPGIKPNAVLSISNGAFSEAAASVGPREACAATSIDNANISRKNCVLLDASGTTDPQGDIAQYAFRVVLVDTANVEHPTIFERTLFGNSAGTETGVTYLSPDDLRGMPPNRSYDVHLTVTDRAGHVSTAGPSRIHVANGQPAVVSPGARVVPFYGEAWANSGLTVTLLGGQNSDPDNDPFCYCWTPVVVPSDQRVALTTRGDGAAAFAAKRDYCSRDPNLRLFVAPAGGPEALVMKLQLVDYVEHPPAGECLDGQGQVESCCHALCRYSENCSQGTFSTVELAPHSPSWGVLTGEGNGAGQTAELRDTNRVSLGSVLANANERPGVSFSPTGPSGARVFVATAISGNHDHVTWTPPGSTTPGITPIALNAPAIDVDELRYDPLRERLWAWGTKPGTGTLAVYSIAAPHASGTLTIEQGWDLSTVLATSREDADIDPTTGRLWIMPLFGADLVVLDPSSATPAGHFQTSAATYAFGGVGVRRMPQEPAQVWAFEDDPTPATGQSSTNILVFSDPAGAAPTQLPSGLLPPANASGSVQVPLFLRFVDPDVGSAPTILWTNFVGIGLSELALATNTAQTPALSVLAQTPAPFGQTMTVDPRTGNVVFLSDDQHTVLHVSLDGSRSEVLSPTTLVSLAGPDPEGLLWTFEAASAASSRTPALLARGEGTGEDGVIGRFSLPAASGIPTIDYGSGDLLVAEAVPPQIERIAINGSVIDVIDHYLPFAGTTPPATLPSPAPAPTALPEISQVVTDPSDGTMWVFAGSTPGVPGAGELDKVLPYATRLVEAPRAAVELEGAKITAVAGDTILAAAVDPLDHSLWVLSLRPAGGALYTVVVQRFSADGVPLGTEVQIQTTLSSVNGNTRPKLARDLASGEICVAWVDTSVGGNPMMRRFKWSGTAAVQVGGTYSPATNTPTLAAVAASRGDCWIAAAGSTNVDLWEPGSGAIHSFTAGASQTILPLNGSQYEANAGRPIEAWIGGTTDLRRVFLTTAGTLQQVDLVPLDFSTDLQTP